MHRACKTGSRRFRRGQHKRILGRVYIRIHAFDNQKIIAPIAEKNIPLAIVFGNHDAESAYVNPFMQRENQICVYSEYDNFRSSMNDEDVFGCANCSLPVLHSNSDKIAWNIWCVDSNDYIRQSDYSRLVDLGYDYVHEDQIAWRERTALRLR